MLVDGVDTSTFVVAEVVVDLEQEVMPNNETTNNKSNPANKIFFIFSPLNFQNSKNYFLLL